MEPRNTRNTRKRPKRRSFVGSPLSGCHIARERGFRPSARLSHDAAFPVFFRVFRVFRGSTFWCCEESPDSVKGGFSSFGTWCWRVEFRVFAPRKPWPEHPRQIRETHTAHESSVTTTHCAAAATPPKARVPGIPGRSPSGADCRPGPAPCRGTADPSRGRRTPDPDPLPRTPRTHPR